MLTVQLSVPEVKSQLQTLLARALEPMAALRSLVSERETRVAQPLGAGAARVCVRGAWWRVSEYAVRARTEAAVRDASIRFRVAPELIRSVIQQESAWNAEAVSSNSAHASPRVR